jgi:hypothetical protein
MVLFEAIWIGFFFKSALCVVLMGEKRWMARKKQDNHL